MCEAYVQVEDGCIGYWFLDSRDPAMSPLVLYL